ncbi:hypothetical protein TNCV_2700131 [Trichonephila clavipes]|nr:hypothetical protein TNCV_2700131 [Trichonephila clavipes]
MEAFLYPPPGDAPSRGYRLPRGKKKVVGTKQLMAPSKAKDFGTFGKQTGENSPLNLKRFAPFLRHTPSTIDYSSLLRILMQLQNVLSLGSKEEMTGSRFGKTLT